MAIKNHNEYLFSWEKRFQNSVYVHICVKTKKIIDVFSFIFLFIYFLTLKSKSTFIRKGQ